MANLPNVRNIAENFNRLSRVHERYRQTDRQEFTFAENAHTHDRYVSGLLRLNFVHGLQFVRSPRGVLKRGTPARDCSERMVPSPPVSKAQI